MNEKAEIQLCLQKIEEKINWKPRDEWKDHEFKLLKNEIYSCSDISISTHTLKRLFGKIKYKSNYSPQHATKDALAKYIGFESWEDFLRKSKDEIERFNNRETSPEIPVSAKMKKRSKRVYITLILLACLIVLVTLIALNSRAPDFSFNVTNKTGVIPHTVVFEYDISKVRSNKVFIDFDYENPVLSDNMVQLDKHSKLLNHTYQIPGRYSPKLIIRNRVVDFDLLVIKSKGWVAFYLNSNEPQRYWMDNMIQDPVYDDYMTLSRQDIVKYGFDSTGVYYTVHRNIMDYGLSGDNFRLKVKFKNGPQNGGISCFDSRCTIISEHSLSYVWMMEENCQQFCELKFGENHFQGETSDLSFLAMDLSDWNILNIEVVDKNATVYINDAKIYEESYTQSSGEIKGLQFRFKGSGMVDNVLMTSVMNDTVYYDDFGF